MSSYVVQDAVIHAVSTWVFSPRNPWQASLVRQTLERTGSVGDSWQEKLSNAMHALNVRAVNERYHESDLARAITFKPLPMATDFEVYDALACWIYQCQEGTVPDTNLFKTMDSIYAAMAHGFVRDMRESGRR